MGLSTLETGAAEGPGAVRSDAAVAEIYHGRCRLFLFEVTVPVQCEDLSELKPEPERFAVTRENVQQGTPIAMPVHSLSKSRFMAGLHCERRLWLLVNRPE